MRLVRLEIKGFKSFAKETILNFSEDVIGVVGPNGSGKSNIVDAIRWVLGEQKKGELRLDKMSSVIFNGTKNRKAGNVAQVFLTFDNDRGVLRTDFQHITIGRLLYRNGDSEYRLNGVPCRRKDITDLFVDTGIESNSYAIIALGMVDDILADNDNSRLRMLEQAAGISVYKLRKRETVSRLERTQEDLDRVQDLLFEIDGQLGGLEKQARRTKKYFELKDTYRELSLDYAYLSSHTIAQQTREVSAELLRAEAVATTKQTELEALEAKVEALREHQLSEEQHLAEQRRQLGSIQGKLRQAINDRQLAEQKLAYLSQNRGKLSAQRSQLEAEHERLQLRQAGQAAALQQAGIDDAAFAKTLETTREEFESLRLGTDQLRNEVKARTLALQAAEREILGVDQAIAITQSRLETIEQEAAARARRAERELERQREASAEAEGATARLHQLRAQLGQEEEVESKRAVEEERLRQHLDDLAPKIRQLRSDQQRAENEAALLRKMLDQLEGSPQSVHYLATKQGWKARYELLGDLLEIDEPYRLAIESVLESELSCFVVPDAATAAEGLRVLAEAGQSPVTIYFLGTREPGSPSLRASTPTPENCQRALDFVRVSAAYQPILEELLADVFVATERIDPRQLSSGQVVVDKSGAQVWTATTGHGGARGKLLGKQTGRRQQLARLESQVERLASEAAGAEATRAEADQALRQSRASGSVQVIKQLRQRVAEAERTAAATQARCEGHELQEEERSRLDAEAVERSRALRQELRTLGERRQPLQLRFEDLLQTQRSGDRAAEEAVEVLAKASAAYNAANLAAIQQQNRLASLQREVNYSTEQLEDNRAAAAEADRALGSDGSEMNALREEIADLATRIDAGQATRATHDERLRTREAEFASARAQLTEDERAVRLLQRATLDASSVVSQLRERKAELSFRMEAVGERLRIEFNLELSTALEHDREVSLSLVELEAQLGKQKSRLEQFGEINPLAVEAYDAMAERREGIDEQRRDIVAAMDDLRETVSEIDRTATEQLTAAFAAVREHFIDVFRHLFDAEDTADMIMLDPSNPLESKIEIVAKPKGKRPQSISQLSGGEKTLTATAFLFALYLIKPAPFCIFDEVDAPLDDANVEKFNRIIKRFSKGSQFIIVTHNKLTMAAVDTIYGVYMPELGVSQVTQVDFREFEHSDVLEMVG